MPKMTYDVRYTVRVSTKVGAAIFRFARDLGMSAPTYIRMILARHVNEKTAAAALNEKGGR